MTVDYAGDYVEAVEWLEQHLTLEEIQAVMHHGVAIAALAQIQFSLESIDQHKQIITERLKAIEELPQASGKGL